MKYLMSVDAVEWTGEWAEVVSWLDSISPGGRYHVPLGRTPHLAICSTDPQVLDVYHPAGKTHCQIGEYVVYLGGGIFDAQPADRLHPLVRTI